MTSRKSFILEEFFSGKVSGWGFTHSRLGKHQNDFTIDAEGRWDAEASTLFLTEAYKFSDGHRDTLRWEIEKKSAKHYIGSEPHLIDNADGRLSAHAFRWKYRRSVPTKAGGSSRLSFDACFLMQEPDVVTARATVSKLGIQIATITAFYLRRK